MAWDSALWSGAAQGDLSNSGCSGELQLRESAHFWAKDRACPFHHTLATPPNQYGEASMELLQPGLSQLRAASVPAGPRGCQFGPCSLAHSTIVLASGL